MISITCEAKSRNRGALSALMVERRRLKHVTPKTLTWYADAFKVPGNQSESVAEAQRFYRIVLEGRQAVIDLVLLRCNVTLYVRIRKVRKQHPSARRAMQPPSKSMGGRCFRPRQCR